MTLNGEIDSIIEKLLPGVPLRQISRITIGWSNEIFVVNEDYIVKIPKVGVDSSGLAKELKVADSLQNKIPVEIPRAISELVNDRITAVAFSYIKGKILTSHDIEGAAPSVNPNKFLTGAVRDAVVKQLADILGAIHGIGTEFAGEMLAPFGSTAWNEKVTATIEECKTASGKVFSGEFLEKCINFLDLLLDRILNFRYDQKFIHGDFGGWNIIFDDISYSIVGIIDWESCRIGDPAFDFAELIYDFGLDFTRSVVQHYRFNSDSTLLERADAYVKLDGFLDLKHGIESDSDFFKQKGISTIKMMVEGQ